MSFNILTYLACICFIFLFGRIFIVPIKKILKLVFNSILGGISIYIINLIGSMYNFHIGLNIFTSIIVGLLGIPGAVLIVIIKLLIQWFWGRRQKSARERKKDDFGVGVIFHSDPKIIFYSTVTDFARFLGLSTSNPFSFEM